MSKTKIDKLKIEDICTAFDIYNKLNEIIDHINEKETDDVQQALLNLLAKFDDYSNPIMMDAEYVRKKIIKFMESVDESKE